tara:strand:- start:1055 stop:1951 length:897 start_codon:yes stop_codon:yes gene_type:complete
MEKRFISLREVGRRLDIPPSTVVYYKDKFSRFIPSEGGGGRRQRYPVEVLEIFRRIREMFNSNWSTEQIERELALKFSALMGSRATDQKGDQLYNGKAESFAQDIGAVLSKMSEALEDQSLFRSEIRSLRDEVAELRKERKASEEMYQRQLGELEQQVHELRKVAAARSGTGDLNFPSNEFLSSPLVICSEGEYLGVQGKGRKHFTLKDFVHLIERKVSDSMSVETSWKEQGGAWVLVVRTSDAKKERQQDIVLVSKKTITPSNNVVTEIVRLNIDGNDAPDALLLTLFRQLKSVFNG